MVRKVISSGKCCGYRKGGQGNGTVWEDIRSGKRHGYRRDVVRDVVRSGELELWKMHDEERKMFRK